MVSRNITFQSLNGSYLFPEVLRRKLAFQQQFPHEKILSLGIGDTTEPLPGVVSQVLADKSLMFSSPEGYSGYGPDLGNMELRKKIAEVIYQNTVDWQEIVISDGSKCDIARLQLLFGSQVKIGVQDPAYPVYVEGSLLNGVKQPVFLPCTPENNFFPDLRNAALCDLLYFCSPNNPTGAVATREQLQELVDTAKKNKQIIIFDAAYSFFIQDEHLPRSIFEIEGAREVAIETHSFSKIAGFTGLRLGWTVVPHQLKYCSGESVKKDWERLVNTTFNGASTLVQQGGIAALSPEGLSEIKKTIEHYLENGRMLFNALKDKYQVYGGTHSPYLWVNVGKPSWEAFDDFLHTYKIVTTPGGGFGPAGEGFLRFSAFGNRKTVQEAIERL